ncbi:Quinol monooxygenase YgiN [Andreprevotia lacus DSM 23236]|jgi:quinol monooxygenase YgiN|uniref:Quinol monooxygenase YgiN n=1 Tax=Andreprevotia lacus DSM 23236 TaxID=1121001 RepID=A0A1W1XM47_9NEIS|nr:putative quinol monooxygenase [Andreprevotia lacus]SMC25059.1 Quinol monooxygenase YgiN [Andreprevotia lacus DSM 23236]
MYLLHAELKARPHAIAEVRSLLDTCRQAARAEPGNLDFAIFCREDSPDEFVVYERYRSKADCELHLHSAPIQAVLQKFELLLQHPPRIVQAGLLAGHFCADD